MKKRNWKKNVVIFGFTMVMAIVAACLLAGFLLSPGKSEVSATPMDGSENKEASVLSTDTIKKMQQEMEQELQALVAEYLQERGLTVDDALREELKEIVRQMELQMEQELVTVREEMKETVTKELETEKAEWKIYIDEQKQPDVQPQITETKKELSSLKEVVSAVRAAYESMQLQFTQLQSGMGNCIVRYNTEDGHFYCVYSEGTGEEVSKKLDFAQ